MNNNATSKHFEWAIIGAGPAGIASIGQLIENGVKAEDILWVDPSFKVGDLAQYWSNVSSNTIVKVFSDFLNKCTAFNYAKRPTEFALDELSPLETCKLSYTIEPLQYVTKELQQIVHSVTTAVAKLELANHFWNLHTADNQLLKARSVIMATGATPCAGFLKQPIEEIDMYNALDSNKLKLKVNANDTVAVFGSSHSAIILLRELLDLGVKQVINFYREPLKFAVPLESWTLFDNTGLKGTTAVWAREHINGQLPERLTRVVSDQANIEQIIPTCTKVIYATGFKPRLIEVVGCPDYKYNPHNGIIAPGLFGVGIAFPESTTDIYGNNELSVGLWKFITYLDRVVPLWLKYST